MPMRFPSPVFQAFGEMFSGGAKPEKVEPQPTRDSAADAVDADRAEDLRRARLTGMAATMLTGSSGVSAELTGTRQLANG